MRFSKAPWLHFHQWKLMGVLSQCQLQWQSVQDIISSEVQGQESRNVFESLIFSLLFLGTRYEINHDLTLFQND